jgi:hypothetical protein
MTTMKYQKYRKAGKAVSLLLNWCSKKYTQMN